LLAGKGIVETDGHRSPFAGLVVGIALLLGIRTILRVRDFKEDATLIQAAYRAHPRNPQILFEMGNEKFTRGDDAGAQKDYEAALALRPAFSLASVNLAWTHYDLKEYGKALRVLDPLAVTSRHVRSMRMVDAKSNYLAGLVLMRQDRTKEAAEALERTLLFYPDHAGARGNLGLLYVRAPNYVDRGLVICNGPSRRSRTRTGD
jgi:tetratricopeptide (TPR) repeat protein